MRTGAAERAVVVAFLRAEAAWHRRCAEHLRSDGREFAIRAAVCNEADAVTIEHLAERIEAGQHLAGDWERSGESWSHRPWWKVLVNTVLRWLQPWAARKRVIYTRSTREGDPPRVLGYGFGRVLHRGKE